MSGGGSVRVVVLVAVAVLATACGPGAHHAPGALAPVSLPPVTQSANPTSPTPPPTSPTPPPTAASPSPTGPPALGPGSSGPAVLALQRRLSSLGYWVGTPDGSFSDVTEQAVYALQKVAGLTPDGLVGPATEAALARGAAPVPRPSTGYVVQVDLARGLVMFTDQGRLRWALNTSTGGGYSYPYNGTVFVARTPVGHFSVFRQVDGTVVDALGQLWRPEFFDAGFAIHGDGYVPPYPVSHGCVRVSDEAIDWVWASGLLPIGAPVWVY